MENQQPTFVRERSPYAVGCCTAHERWPWRHEVETLTPPSSVPDKRLRTGDTAFLRCLARRAPLTAQDGLAQVPSGPTRRR